MGLVGPKASESTKGVAREGGLSPSREHMATIAPQHHQVHLPYQEKKKSKIKLRSFGLPHLMLFLFISICGLSLFYLSEFNHIASQGVVINDLERDRSRLMIENEVWNMRMAKLKSLDVIEHQEVVKKMQSIDPKEIEFVDLAEKAIKK